MSAVADLLKPTRRTTGSKVERFLIAIWPRDGQAAIAGAEQQRVGIETFPPAGGEPKKHYERQYVVRLAEVIPLRDDFSRLVERTKEIADALVHGTPVRIIADVTECGHALLALWKETTMRPVAVQLTSGRLEAGSGYELTSALIKIESATNTALEEGRLRISAALGGALHDAEMAAIRLAVWYGERGEIPTQFATLGLMGR